MKTNLTGKVLWSFDHEIQVRNKNQDFAFHFSFAQPFHCHSGSISIEEFSIQIKGDYELLLPLSELSQLYLGFDENYTAILAKNFGLLWQPLRLTTIDEQQIYLIIDYNFFTTNNKNWFESLQQILK